VDVDPPEALGHELMSLDELQGFLMVEQGRARQGREESQDLSPPLHGPARQLADHEGMSPHLADTQAIRQAVVAPTEMVDPNGGVDEHSVTSTYRAAAANRLQAPLLAAESGQTPGALPGDQRLESGVEHRRLHPQSAQPLGLREEAVIDVEGRAHNA
jgi:hypothetical protein